MTPLATIRLVARRELRDRLGNRAFLFTTAISLVVIVGIIVAPSFFADDGPATYDVGIVAGADLPASFADTLAAAAGAADAEVTTSEVADRTAAEDAVAEGELDVVVLDRRTVLAEGLGSGSQLRLLLQQSLSGAALADVLAEADVDPAQVGSLLGGELRVLAPGGEDEAVQESAFGLGFFVTVLLFLTLQINGASLLTTTVEEKSSRVVEVLLGTIRPWQLLAGKLVAMTILSVGQLVLYAVAALAAVSLVGEFTLPPASPTVIVAGIVMFLLGFGMWASIYAVAGALATSAEEAQSASGPIGFTAAAVYMAVLIGVVPNPDGTLARVLSFLPPSAPFAVPARAASGLPAWELVVAAVLTALGTWLVVRLAGRLYSAAVLSGGRLTWRSAFRAEPIR